MSRRLPVVSGTDLPCKHGLLFFFPPCHPTVSVACIPCFSRDSSVNSLEIPFSGLQIKPTMYKEREDEGRTHTAAASSTDFLHGPQARLSLQTLDSKSQLHRDQLSSLPPESPGHTEGLHVDIQAWQDGMEGCGVGFSSTTSQRNSLETAKQHL